MLMNYDFVVNSPFYIIALVFLTYLNSNKRAGTPMGSGPLN